MNTPSFFWNHRYKGLPDYRETVTNFFASSVSSSAFLETLRTKSISNLFESISSFFKTGSISESPAQATFRKLSR